MTKQNEISQVQDLNELVNRIIDELRPLVAEIVKKAQSNEQALIVETSTETPVESEEKGEKNENQNNEFIKKFDSLLEKLDFVLDNDVKFNKMHAELDEYRKGLYRKILSPILKNIVTQYSKVNDLYAFYNGKHEEENVDYAQLFVKLLNEYNNLKLGLSDLLYDYDIEIVEPKTDEEFNPKKHKAIKTIAIDDAEKDGKIAVCVTVGFKDVSANDQIVKYPEVEIFKLNQ